MDTMQQRWQSYRDDVIPKDASAVQINECRLAFYAGAIAALNVTLTVADMTEEEGFSALESVHTELSEFARDYRPRHKVQ